MPTRTTRARNSGNGNGNGNGHGSHGHQSSPLSSQRHLLLDPRFLIQIAGILVSAVALYYAMVNKQDALSHEQLRQSATLEKIESRLPNNEALELRLKSIETEVESLKVEVKDFDSWVRITREQLAAKGFKP